MQDTGINVSYSELVAHLQKEFLVDESRQKKEFELQHQIAVQVLTEQWEDFFPNVPFSEGELNRKVALYLQGQSGGIGSRITPVKTRKLSIFQSILYSLLWFRILGVGLFLPKKAKFSDYTKPGEMSRFIEKIIEIVRQDRPDCAEVRVLNRCSRSRQLTCCDKGMIAVDVYYPKQGHFSTRMYRANPSFVCGSCFRYMDPCEYDYPSV